MNNDFDKTLPAVSQIRRQYEKLRREILYGSHSRERRKELIIQARKIAVQHAYKLRYSRIDEQIYEAVRLLDVDFYQADDSLTQRYINKMMRGAK